VGWQVRKVKNEFLVRLQEIQEGGSLYFIAATNTPQEIDEAVMRRLERKFYIPLPDADARWEGLSTLGLPMEMTC
jgi:SpoVK/Ycf46/Vps4 family AAA+-type ATPase